MLPTENREFRTFAEVMVANEKRTGTIEELTKMLHEVATAVRKTGKKGTVTLKVEVECDKNDELALTLRATPSCSVPAPDRRKAMLFHDGERGVFAKTDPRQLELLAEQEAEKASRERELNERGIARIGRGGADGTVIDATATG